MRSVFTIPFLNSVSHLCWGVIITSPCGHKFHQRVANLILSQPNAFAPLCIHLGRVQGAVHQAVVLVPPIMSEQSQVGRGVGSAAKGWWVS